MSINIKDYERYYTYDEPIIYKNLKIYPVKVIDYLRFYIDINCIMIEKNKIPDPKVISMSYLDFLFHLIKNDENGNYYAYMLSDLLSLCLGINKNNIDYKINEKGKVNLILKINNEENDEYIEHIINKDDFDNIRKIICYQNMPDYDETYIDPKVEEVLKEAQDFINRNKKKTSSLEDQIICVMLALHESDKEKIHNLSIRKFVKILQRYDYKLHYEIYKTAEFSGMVTFKQEISHWMSDLSSNNKYSDVIVEYGQFKNKIESAKA